MPEEPDAIASLARRLGVDEDRLTALTAYDGADLARLDAAVARAMSDEDQAFAAAIEKALGLVPRMLRGTAEKLLQGADRA